METPDTILRGAERVLHFESFGRLTRLGDPAALEVSDAERVREAFEAGLFHKGETYLEALQPLLYVTITTSLEWAATLSSLTAERCGAETERAVAKETFEAWSGGQSIYTDVEPEAVDTMSALLHPARMIPATVAEFRTPDGPPGPAPTMLNDFPLTCLANCLDASGAGDRETALGEFKKYLHSVRARHDLIGHYVGLYGAALKSRIGEASAADIMQRGLESCAVLQGMWAFVERAAPAELALMLAEYLRSLFSGPGREGSVTIVEEPDRYRLVMDPCGSGGAMRRRKIPGLAVFSEPSPVTWRRSGEVPAYCAHCASNELTSIDRFGTLAWVTEFDPDPMKPCGWTVYKDRSKIPAKYYERIGFEKPKA